MLVHTVFVQLDDLFDYNYDQNKDDDSTNDYIAMRPLGWYDEWYIEFFNADWINDYGNGMNKPTVQHIADLVEWDGVIAASRFSELELRQIKVTYVGNGFEDKNSLNEVVYVCFGTTRLTFLV